MRAKEFLLQARGIDAEIRSLKESEREAWERVTNITPNYDGNMISGSKDPHKFDFLMDYIDKLVALECQLAQTREEVLLKIYRLKNRNERLVLKTYYIDFKKWERISLDMNFSYRQVIRIHARALKHIEELLGGET